MSKPTKGSNIQIPNDILKELLTPSEIRMLKNRWHIMNLFKERLPIRKIAAKAKVGTDTVVRTIRLMEKNNILTGSKKEIKSLTPWIFGKSD